ncbi:MAG: hypothetical protein WDO15_02070 [Bacteroidota bacterium]
MSKVFGISFEEFERTVGFYSYYIFPAKDIHLYQTELMDSLQPKSDIKYVYILGAVGAFILVIACINFMNLSTARSASRAKEVGLEEDTRVRNEANSYCNFFRSRSFILWLGLLLR